jgi:hypothetical protein
MSSRCRLTSLGHAEGRSNGATALEPAAASSSASAQHSLLQRGARLAAAPFALARQWLLKDSEPAAPPAVQHADDAGVRRPRDSAQEVPEGRAASVSVRPTHHHVAHAPKRAHSTTPFESARHEAETHAAQGGWRSASLRPARARGEGAEGSGVPVADSRHFVGRTASLAASQALREVHVEAASEQASPRAAGDEPRFF